MLLGSELVLGFSAARRRALLSKMEFLSYKLIYSNSLENIINHTNLLEISELKSTMVRIGLGNSLITLYPKILKNFFNIIPKIKFSISLMSAATLLGANPVG